ncbi:MAG: response regulator [Bacteroidetes bacterium]|nr:response regulator [Bacteroidota bacterium]
MTEKNILVVDDSDFMHKMYNVALNAGTNYKYKITHAYNGREGLDLLFRGNQFDAIFLDINMPVLSGIDFLKSVREKLPRFPVPIIVISTENKESDINLATALGAKAYLAKPFQPSDLRDKLEKLLAGNHHPASVS